MKAGKALKAIRQFHGMTITEVASAIKYSKSHISELESDKKTPSIEVLERYSELFEMPISSITLLAETEEPSSKNLKQMVRKITSKTVLGILEAMASRK